MTTQEKLETIIKTLDSKKAVDIKVIGITNLTILADYFVIATGTCKRNQTRRRAEVQIAYYQAGGFGTVQGSSLQGDRK